MASRDSINEMLDKTRLSLGRAHQLASVQEALRTLDTAQRRLNDPRTIVKDEYDPLLNMKPINTFTNDELLAEISSRMAAAEWVPATG